jgi:taurine dioxygenase
MRRKVLRPVMNPSSRGSVHRVEATISQWQPSALAAEGSTPRVHGLKKSDVDFLAENGVTIKAISPLGAEVRGINLRQKPPEPVLEVLESAMAIRGFLVFKDQGVLTGDEQVEASEYWGARQVHSTHGVHPEAPNRHIFRLANDRQVGILGVGPQWHNDGSFERATFSHVGYHIVRVAEKGGGTIFAHQGAAFDALPSEAQERWGRLVSVNSNSGVLHPVVHEHPISGRKSVYLHLGMTGAVIEVLEPAPSSALSSAAPGEASTASATPANQRLRLLDEAEMRELFQQYNALLNAGFVPSRADLLGAAPRYGTTVTIEGLAEGEAAGVLNGQAGIVSGVLDRRNGRVTVDVDASVLSELSGAAGAAAGTGEEAANARGVKARLALDPANLKLDSAAASAGGDESASEASAYTMVYEYEAGDCIFIDNLAVAHRATPEAHQPSSEVGLRILHRTTIRAESYFDPPFGLPPRLDIHDSRTPKRALGIDDGAGVWDGGGLGFRWDETIPMQN